MPEKYDLNLYRGDSYGWQFILWQDTEKTVPVNLTDATVASEIRNKPDGLTIVSLTCNVVLPNTVEVLMDPDMYDSLPIRGVWDLEVTFPDGEVLTPIAGDTIITPDVTVPSVP